MTRDSLVDADLTTQRLHVISQILQEPNPHHRCATLDQAWLYPVERGKPWEGEEAVIALLHQCLRQEPDAAVRQQLVAGLGTFSHGAALRALATVLYDPIVEVRSTMLRAVMHCYEQCLNRYLHDPAAFRVVAVNARNITAQLTLDPDPTLQAKAQVCYARYERALR